MPRETATSRRLETIAAETARELLRDPAFKAAVKRAATARGRRTVPLITAEEFDRLADLPHDDPKGDLSPYIDYEHATRPGRAVQRVTIDIPTDLLRAIDLEAARIGVTRQALIKLPLADAMGAARAKDRS